MASTPKFLTEIKASGNRNCHNGLDSGLGINEILQVFNGNYNMISETDAKKIVMSYITALDSGDYQAAQELLGDNVRVKGPAGEAFRTPAEFIEMLRKQNGKYDLKKIFVDDDEVCVLYDFVTPKVRTFFCSWYHVKDGRIVSIQTVFDPRAFSA
jgi:ketosteroid isomerase-like protein